VTNDQVEAREAAEDDESQRVSVNKCGLGDTAERTAATH
jgi:hypothetical protein